jgi:TRAP-type C4-dicarboxylate transport system permease small subunit
MGGLVWITERLSKWMNVISGCAITFIMLLTVSDVVLRFFGHPVIGTFEMVGLGGAVLIGFGIPNCSWTRGHIFVDFAVQKFPKGGAKAINLITRLMSIAIFILIGYNLFLYSHDLYLSGEGTLTLQLPFYPISYGLGVCCFIQCLVLVCDIVKIFGGTYE